jgi:hypothetical protein
MQQCALAGTLLLAAGLLVFGPAPLLGGYQQDTLYRLALTGFVVLCGYSFSRTQQTA